MSNTDGSNSTTPSNDWVSLAKYIGKPIILFLLFIPLLIIAISYWQAEPGTNIKLFKVIEFKKPMTLEKRLEVATSNAIDAFSVHRLTINTVSTCKMYRISGSGVDEEIDITKYAFSLIGFHIVLQAGTHRFEIPVPDLVVDKSKEITSAYSNLKEICRKYETNS